MASRVPSMSTSSQASEPDADNLQGRRHHRVRGWLRVYAEAETTLDGMAWSRRCSIRISPTTSTSSSTTTRASSAKLITCAPRPCPPGAFSARNIPMLPPGGPLPSWAEHRHHHVPHAVCAAGAAQDLWRLLLLLLPLLFLLWCCCKERRKQSELADIVCARMLCVRTYYPEMGVGPPPPLHGIDAGACPKSCSLYPSGSLPPWRAAGRSKCCRRRHRRDAAAPAAEAFFNSVSSEALPSSGMEGRLRTNATSPYRWDVDVNRFILLGSDRMGASGGPQRGVG